MSLSPLRSVPCALLALVALGACGPSAPIDMPDLGTTGDETSDGPGSTSGGSTTAPDEPEPGSSDGEDEPPSTFISDPDAGIEAFECDTWVQDCPSGYKCTFWANDGGSSWNATRCVEIDPDPDGIGEPCTVVGNGVTGIDSCEFGSMCWDVDGETNEGTCVEFCTGDESSPICTDPTMICAGRGPYLCLPTCCPLEQDCPEGQACYPIGHTFQCAPDAGGDMGAFGDPCEYINVCDPGLLCLDAGSVVDCEGNIGCCTAYCEVGSDTCGLLHPELECTPWHEEGTAPPGLDHIGACTVPQ